jgi:hypothetical protein
LPRPILNSRTSPPGFFHQTLQLLRDICVAQPSFMCGCLHRNRKKLRVVTFEVALQKRDHVTGGTHAVSNNSSYGS